MRRILLLATSTAALVTGLGCQDATAISIDLPTAVSMGSRQSFGCRALMESDMTGSYDPTLMKGLQGKSQAGFSAGTARGASFEILRNSEDELVATYFDGTSVNTFVLNKSNGLAIWSKIRSTFPGYGAPTGAQSYLVCH